MIKKIALLSAIILLTFLLIYCTTDETSFIGPFGDASKYITIANLSADKTLLYSNGDSTKIRIKILDVDKEPAIGLIIGFSTQIGNITESDMTDSSGIALATFVSDVNAGENIITIDTGVKKHTLALNIVHYQPKYVEMFSASPVLLADGNSKTTITAVLKDSVGNPMPGLLVTFETTLGTLYPRYLQTDDNGVAITTLTSVAEEGIATVTATSFVTIEIEVEFKKYVPAFIEISAESPWLWADGQSLTKIITILKDSVGKPMPNTTVNFTTSLGMLSSQIELTNDEGTATTELTSIAEEGIAMVTATSYIKESVSIEFIPFAPNTIEMSVSPTTILADSASTSIITAISKDRNGTPIPDINLLFSTTQGTLSDTTGRSNQNGVATTTITSAASSQDITAIIKATATDNTSISEDIELLFRGIYSITHIDSAKMSDGGIYEAKIRTSFLEDTNGNGVSGKAVYFSSPVGKIIEALVDTDEQGTAVAVFNAEVLPTNQNNVFVKSELSSTALVFSVSDKFDIPGAEMLVSTIDDEIMGDGVGYALVKATLREITGKAITGTRVDWETTLGTIKRQSKTNTTGHAIDTLTIEAGVGQSTNVTIRANYGDYVSASNIITIIPPTTSKRIIIGAEPDITEGPCFTFDSLRTCVYGIDNAGNIVYGDGAYSPTYGWPIHCGPVGDTWCYRICGQDIVQAGAYGTRDIAVTAIFKDEYNNPIYDQTLSFWLTPADAQATICEQDIVPNLLGYARVTLTYPIQSGGELVRIWAKAPDGTKGSIDVVLPVVVGE